MHTSASVRGQKVKRGVLAVDLVNMINKIFENKILFTSYLFT